MSLTDFTERPAIKAAYLQHAARVSLPLKPREIRTLVESCGRRHSTVGTAFDYMARFATARHLHAQGLATQDNPGLGGPRCAIHDTGWIAEHAAELIRTNYGNEPWARRWCAIIAAGRALYEEFRTGAPISIERIAICAQYMAAADMLVRIGDFNPGCTEDHAITDELVELYTLYDPAAIYGAPSRTCLLNPAFVVAPLIGGGDADILVDGLLVDIKTTISPGMNSAHLRQLAGYAALHRMGGIRLADDSVHREPVTEVALYFSRQGLLARWSMEELFPNGGFEHFNQAFQAEFGLVTGLGADPVAALRELAASGAAAPRPALA